jgi:hypothetical protein
MPHASKSPKVADVRRKRLVQAVINGENLRDVAISTGLSPRTAGSQASQILKHPQAQESFLKILEGEGLTDEFLAGKVVELLEAETTHYFAKDGVVTDTLKSPAHETQRKTLELVARMKGHLKEQSQGDINIGLMQMVVNAVSGKAGMDGREP